MEDIISKFFNEKRIIKINSLFIELNSVIDRSRHWLDWNENYLIWFENLKNEISPFLFEISNWIYNNDEFHAKEIREYPVPVVNNRKLLKYEDNEVFDLRAVDNFLKKFEDKIKNNEFTFEGISEFKTYLIMGLKFQYLTQKKNITDHLRVVNNTRRNLVRHNENKCYDEYGETIDTSRLSSRERKKLESKKSKSVLFNIIKLMNEMYGIDNTKRFLTEDVTSNKIREFIQTCIDLIYYKQIYFNKELEYSELVLEDTPFYNKNEDTLRNKKTRCNKTEDEFADLWKFKIRTLLSRYR